MIPGPRAFPAPIALSLVLAHGLAFADAITLEPSRAPASGRRTAALAVTRFGRYAITAASAQGTALQLVDRIAGPGPVAGEAGKQNGRLDVFLDRGGYRVVAISDERGRGEVELRARPFVERNAPPPLLVEWKPVDGALDDLEQRSWWLVVEKRRRVAIEAAGRSLSDLRLWTNGEWLVDAEPDSAVVSPRAGRPLRVRRLHADLPPGKYLLTAYGGAAEPWAEEADEHPLHLRYGIPPLPTVGRRRREVGPLGVDRFLLPGRASFVRVELAEPAALELETSDAVEPDPFGAGDRVAEIRKSSLVPAAELELARRDGARVVTVRADAGTSYVLQHFDFGEPAGCGCRRWTLQRTGKHWVSTVHSGDPADSIDATGIVDRRPLRGEDEARRRREPFATAVAELDEKGTWARRANLVDELSLFVRIPRAGKHVVFARGAEARFRFEPFMLCGAEGYEAPPFRDAGFVWDLEPGLYVLSAEPVKKGIVDLAIRAGDGGETAEAIFARRLGRGRERELAELAAAVQFPELELDGEHDYDLWLNRQPEVNAGLVLRPLPVDLSEPLPIFLRAEQTIEVPVRVPEAGKLAAVVEEAGATVEVSLDGGAFGASQPVAPGERRAAVRNSTARAAEVSLVLEPERLRAEAPLPPLPDAASGAPPDLPLLSAGEPRFVDLEREGTATFLVRVSSPGFYRLASTGLLATRGTLRTRTIPSLEREQENGVGRNFAIEQYLGEGDYQLTLAARGKSRGRAGVTLEKETFVRAGTLSPGHPAPIALAAGEGAEYSFAVADAGDYRLRTLEAAAAPLRYRLEDADGWPIEPPGGAADVTRRFEAGMYRVLVLPEGVGLRRVTVLEPVAKPVRFEGHGPHTLPLAARIEKEWREPADGAPRAADSWTFAAPAAVDATITLTAGMEGRLFRGGALVAEVAAERGWKGRLEPGVHRLEVVSARRNDRQRYELEVGFDQLVAGTARAVTAPATVPVSVGTDGLVEIASFGAASVRARLLAEDGRVVGRADGAAEDWNFRLEERLPAGFYRLEVEPVAAESAETSLSMRAAVEEAAPALALPVAETLRIGATARVYPLTVSPGADFLAAGAVSDEGAGIALETAEGEGWWTLATASGRAASLDAPLAPAGVRYRLRLWSPGGRDASVRLTAAAVAAARATEGELARGVSPRRVPGVEPPVAALAVALERPGVFRFADAAAELRAAAGVLWVVRAGAAKVRAARVVIGAGEKRGVTVPLEPGAAPTADVEPGGGSFVAIARSESGDVGVAAGAARGSRMAVAERAAAAVGLGRSPREATVWAAGSPAATEARVHAFAYAATEAAAAALGTTQGTLHGERAASFDLPPGRKRLRLAVGDATVAALSDGDEVESVHWDGGAAFDESLQTSARRLTLFHTGAGEDRYAIELLPGAEAAPPLHPGSPFESRELSAGRLRIPVAPGASDPADPSGAATLHVRGASGVPVYVAASGEVRRGADVALPGDGDGWLLVPERPGLVLAWVDRKDAEAADLFGDEKSPRATDEELPSIVPLSGRRQTIRVRAPAASVVHARSATPMVTVVRSEGAPPRVDVHADGCVLDAYVAPGAVEIAVRGVGGDGLSGTLQLTSSPVVAIGEGLGEESLLPAGETRLFSFAVSRQGPVGIGVRSVPDVAVASLLDVAGRRIGGGVVQMPSLEPGTYLLEVHVPETSGPARIRPALAGIDRPSTGPPDDVVRGYLETAGWRKR